MKILTILLPFYFVMVSTYSVETKRYERTRNFENNIEIDTINYATIKCGRGILGLSCGSLCVWNCRNYYVLNYYEKTGSGGNDNADNAGIKTKEESTKIKLVHRKEFNKPPNIIKLGEKFKNLLISNSTSRSNRIKRELKRRNNGLRSSRRFSRNYEGQEEILKKLSKFNGYMNTRFYNNDRLQRPTKQTDKVYKVINFNNKINFPKEPMRADIGIGRSQRLSTLVITFCSENDSREICNVERNGKNKNRESENEKPEVNIQFSPEESFDESETKKTDYENNDLLKKNDSNHCNCTYKDDGKWENVTNKPEKETISPVTKKSSLKDYIENKEEKKIQNPEVKETRKKTLRNPLRLVAPYKINVITFRDNLNDVKNETITDVAPDKEEIITNREVPTDVKNNTIANFE